MDFNSIFKAVGENPTAALLVLALLALAWFVRDARQTEREHAAQIAALYESHAKATSEANAAHLQTALQVAPLASKLVDCIAILERLTAARGGGA